MVDLSNEERAAWRNVYVRQLAQEGKPAVDAAIDSLVQMNWNFRRHREEAANSRRVYGLIGFVGGGFVGGLGSGEWGHPMGGLAAIVLGTLVLVVLASIASFRADKLQKAVDRATLKLDR